MALMETTLPKTASGLRWRRSDRGVLAITLAFVLCLPLLTPRIYAVDSVEYYVYLRSLFFDGDLDFTNDYTRFHELNPRAGLKEGLLDVPPTPTGLPINLAPVGTAILWSPAFLLAHGAVLLARGAGFDVAADGYSAPYIRAIAIATALYGYLALLLMYGMARRYATTATAAAAVIVCWLASPMVFFMYVSPPWSHVPALAMTTAFIATWLRTRGQRSTLAWVALGVLGGLMTLCREQLGLFMLLPALEATAIYARFVVQRRWRDAATLLAQHLLFLGVLVLTLVPQLLVYQVLNGQPAPASTVSEKFRWSSPHFFHTLFDPAHGAFLWTPVWALGVAGLALLWRKDWQLTGLLGAVLVSQVYLNGAFGTTWHLSGSFGFRRLIEASPIFVLGLAALLDRVRVPRAAVIALGAVLVAWNIGLIAQWSLPPRPIKDGLVWDGMVGRQIGVARTVVETLPTLFFDRCKLVENGRC
jgi:hypothetical protein